MVRVKYLGGFCRLYGQEFYTSLGWYEVNNTVYLRVRGSPEWLVEGEEESVEEVEEVEEVVEEAAEETEEETSDETDLSTLTKKELQALCDEAGLSYKSLDNKAALLSLLESVDSEESLDDEEE
jgi:hypothetical protein